MVTKNDYLLKFCTFEKIDCKVKIISTKSKFYGKKYDLIKRSYWGECTVYNSDIKRHLSYSPWNVEILNTDDILKTTVEKSELTDFFKTEIQLNDLLFGESALVKVTLLGTKSLIIKHIVDSGCHRNSKRYSRWNYAEFQTLTKDDVSEYIRIDDPTLVFRLPLDEGR